MDKTEYRELASLAANGDAKSFAKLYETIYREMYYTAYYSLADEADTVEVMTDTIKNTFKAAGRLHTEGAFRLYMMKSLCAGIKAKFREYPSDRLNDSPHDSDEFDIKCEFDRLTHTERLVASLYAGGKFRPEEIAQFTGLSLTSVKRRLDSAMKGFALD